MYNLSLVLKAVRLLVLLALAAAIVWALFKRKGSLKTQDIKKRWFRFLPVILVAALLGSTLELVYLKIQGTQQVSCKIGYNYPEASIGRTPGGLKLDVTEVIGDEVLAEVAATGDFGDVAVDELKAVLSIKNADEVKSISAEQQYISTEYILSYNGSAETKNIDGKELLSAVGTVYREYFKNHYGRKTDILEVDFSGLEDMDYFDISEHLDFELNNIINYMSACRSSAPTYVSEETGESFGSLQEKAENYQAAALENYGAYLLQYGISNDKDEYISRLDYDNRILEMSYLKSNAAYEILVETIDKYDEEIIRSVLVPTRDETGEFYQSRTKIGTDLFAEDANLYLSDATETKLEIEGNNLTIKSLKAGNPTEENFAKADEMIEEMTAEITELSDLAIRTVQSYDEERVKNYMNFSFGSDRPISTSEIIKTAVYAGLVLVLVAMLVAVADTDLKRKRR